MQNVIVTMKITVREENAINKAQGNYYSSREIQGEQPRTVTEV